MNRSDCAAKRQKQELKKLGTRPQVVTAQVIAGVIIPPPYVPVQGFTHQPQIIQKSCLASDCPACPGFAQEVEVTDQAVGYGTEPEKNYESFSKDPTTKSGGSKGREFQTSQVMSQTQADTHKMRFSQSGLLYTLHMIREPVVEYQESRGVPRNEEITFLTLVTSLCTQAYTAAITILVMLWNLMPLVDGLVYFVRFILDKTIDIVQTEDKKDKAIKCAIFFGELTIITFIIFMIVGLIFMPVYVLMARLFSKIFSMVAW